MAADLDGDCNLDLASANFDGDDLTVFFQTAAGSFDPIPLVLGGSPTTEGPFFLAAADLDGDGDLDLASANFEGHDLTIFFQDGPRSFDPSPLVLGDSMTTVNPYSVAAADLDGDGDQDLVSTNVGSHDLTVFFQSGPRSFDPSPLVLGGLPTTIAPVSVVATDFDGDGDQDLASANFDGHDLTVFFQSSPGDFAPSPLVLGGDSTINAPAALLVADLDGDGGQDLVSADEGGDDLRVFLQHSLVSFAPSPLLLGGSLTTEGLAALSAADLDGDGDLDLASANQFSDNLALFFQGSPGSFDPSPRVVGGLPATDGPRSVAAADLDGDGDQDLVSANFGKDDLTIFLQSEPATFESSPIVLGDTPTREGPVSVAATDLDGDLDLVAANSDGDDLTVFFQDGPGDYEPPFDLGDPTTTKGPACVTAADLDVDGDRDLVSANFDGDDLTVFFQEGPRSFAPLVLGGSLTTKGPRSVAAADLDVDGDPDLVSANSEGDDLTVFFQEGPRSFAPLALGGSPTTKGPRSVAAADLDGDGDLDLVAANLVGQDLTVFLQRWPRSFAPNPLVLGDSSTTGAPLFVAAPDLDGDGDLDLAAADQLEGNLVLFWGGR